VRRSNSDVSESEASTEGRSSDSDESIGSEQESLRTMVMCIQKEVKEMKSMLRCLIDSKVSGEGSAR
jgi:hypothetical protein